MSRRPLADERWYSTPTLLKVMNPTLAAYTDAQVREYIEQTSILADEHTGQTFWPVDEVAYCRGQSDDAVEHPKKWRVVNVSAVEYSSNRSKYSNLSPTFPDLTYVNPVEQWVAIDSTLWNADNRGVFMAKQVFPRGFNNVRINGVFGWLDNSRGLVESTLTAILATGDTTVTVADGSIFYKRDIIDITPAGETQSIRAIVENVTGNVLRIDAVVGAGAAIGSVVSTWGQVPKRLEMVIARWVGVLLDVIAGGAGFVPPGTIIRERTDSYEYERDKRTVSDDGTGQITGDPLADQWLNAFRDAYIGFV